MTILARATIAGRWRREASVMLVASLATLAGCSEPAGTGGPAAERGRQIYLAQCIACHNTDPGVAGPVGPPVRGASPELLAAKVLKGAYPPGYAPKRPTTLMPLQPALEPEIPNLAAFLQKK
jgi:mono/diheme cytochrome c family protein